MCKGILVLNISILFYFYFDFKDILVVREIYVFIFEVKNLKIFLV